MNRYLLAYAPTHPKASASGCVYAHILVAEQALGHSLPGGSQVHHVDENKRNNANGNLVICQDMAYHKLLHVRARVLRAGGNPNTERICAHCQALKAFAAFNRNSKNRADGLQQQCRECQSAYTKTYVRPSKREAA